MEGKVVLRDARSGDLASLLSIQKSSPGAAAWNRAAYESLLSADGVICFVAEAREEERIGFVVARVMADEMEILNLAVLPAQRRHGLGRRLVMKALERGRAGGAQRCWLEVRASNRAALEFYRSLGFREQTRRPSYYRDPEEDAVVCRRALP